MALVKKPMNSQSFAYFFAISPGKAVPSRRRLCERDVFHNLWGWDSAQIFRPGRP
jgi:hypothetical protein